MKTIEDAASALAEVFGDGYTAGDVGGHFTCLEANTIAHVLLAGGQTEAAKTWLAAHSEGDDEGDQHFELDSDDLASRYVVMMRDGVCLHIEEYGTEGKTVCERCGEELVSTGDGFYDWKVKG